MKKCDFRPIKKPPHYRIGRRPLDTVGSNYVAFCVIGPDRQQEDAQWFRIPVERVRSLKCELPDKDGGRSAVTAFRLVICNRQQD